MALAAMVMSFWRRRSAAPDAVEDVRSIYEAHASFVWKTLSRMGVHPNDLLDCSQEVFLVVHRRLADRDGTSLVTTWLYGICLRVAAGYRRRAFRRYEQVSERTHEVEDESRERAADALVRQRDSRALLESILNKMPTNPRVVFVMFELDELSCPEIAEQLGCPLGTVHTRLRAARKVFEESVAEIREANAAQENVR
jgi:RNA polymerase sigma-70 factor (ECF subfamily)